MSLLNIFKNFLREQEEKEGEWVLNPMDADPYVPQTSQIPEDYTVEIVETYNEDGRCTGSHIEPPLSSIVNASDLDRLRWKAACVNAEHPELKIKINEGSYTIGGVRQNGYFNIQVGWSATGADFDSAWTLLNGISMGAHVVKQKREIEGFEI